MSRHGIYPVCCEEWNWSSEGEEQQYNFVLFSRTSVYSSNQTCGIRIWPEKDLQCAAITIKKISLSCCFHSLWQNKSAGTLDVVVTSCCSAARRRLLCQVTRECSGASDGLGFPRIVKLLGLPQYTADFLSQEGISLEHGFDPGGVVP